MNEWAISVIKCSGVSLALTLLASLGSQPSYNVPLALLGVFVAHFPKPFLTSLLAVVLPVTIILDITYASLYGPYLGSGAPLMSLILSVINMFLKLPWAYVSFELMNETGGNPMMLLTPELIHTAGSHSGPGSEHERIADI